ncbi:MAG TPA: response regulator transcription factor [Aggregatilineales bacterium]|nr:response regulator transcription factor [Aggregatilineales bacterium]
MIKIVIIDDYEMVRRGLKWLISRADDMEIVGVGKNGDEALTLCQTHLPDVVLMDVEMPRLDGVSAAKIIRNQFASLPIILLGNFFEDIKTDDILLAGANAHLLKEGEGHEILQTIRDLVRLNDC